MLITVISRTTKSVLCAWQCVKALGIKSYNSLMRNVSGLSRVEGQRKKEGTKRGNKRVKIKIPFGRKCIKL